MPGRNRRKFFLRDASESALSLVFTVVLVTDVLLQLDHVQYMEQLTCQSARQGSQLHRIQNTTENIQVSDGLRRIVTFLAER